MGTWIKQFIYSSRETKWYVLNWFIYGFIIVLSTIYCYMRLDFVRSYKPSLPTSSSGKKLQDDVQDSAILRRANLEESWLTRDSSNIDIRLAFIPQEIDGKLGFKTTNRRNF